MESFNDVFNSVLKYCKDCGKIINKKAERCPECSNKIKRIIERPSREELKSLIRNQPFTQIGIKFGVTDNAIRKWCDAEGLPRKKKDIQSIKNDNFVEPDPKNVILETKPVV